MPLNFTAGAEALNNVNTGNLGEDYDNIMRLSNSLNKVRHFGKAWDIGDQATVFYPFKWYPSAGPAGGSFKPHTCAYFGHKVSDFKALGTSFVRSMAIIDEYGEVVEPGDLAYQFSKVAPLLLLAKKEREIAELNARDWSILGQSAYQQAYKKIEESYNAKENMSAARPLLGRLSILKLTEVAYVAMDPNTNVPIFDSERKPKTGRYIQELSDGKLLKITTLANDSNHGILAQNPGLVPEEGKVYFVEVMYNFTSASNKRSEAGRTDPQGVAAALTLAHKHPELKEKIDDLLSRVPVRSDGIAQHTYNMAPMPEAVLKTKLQAVMFEGIPNLCYLSPDDKDRLVHSAKLFDNLRIAPKEDAELHARLEQELGHPIGEPSTEKGAPTLRTISMQGDTPDFSQQVDESVDVESLKTSDMEDILSGIDLEVRNE